ncbi:MAG: triose-phosphate isomerase [Candidatus Binatia bacterium]|nr:triose-phosphate isomerase [Candidatus Binatia bacterium]
MVTRCPLIIGNWKMHCTRAETEHLLSAVLAQLSLPPEREVAVAPPFTALETAARLLAGSAIRLAAQNLHWEPQGAFTGEISGPMLKELGCTYVIIGHSERRQYCGETDAQIARKVRAAQRAGLVPVICVGETLEEREQGATLAVIRRQVRGALQDQAPLAIASLVIAYEPVWAIGTGRTATPSQAQAVHEAIRNLLAELSNSETANTTRILYGGSVKPDNIDSLMAEADIDGALVGGASLQADSFVRIATFR